MIEAICLLGGHENYIFNIEAFSLFRVGFPTSSCAGPLVLSTAGNIETAELDVAHTTIVVLGKLNAAASVPKLFNLDQTQLYLYYDHFLLTSGKQYLQQMGIKVEEVDGCLFAQGQENVFNNFGIFKSIFILQVKVTHCLLMIRLLSGFGNRHLHRL